MCQPPRLCAVLADPMCGSGTILIEAALMASRTAPGLFRTRWPFQAWPDFDAKVGAGLAWAPARRVVLMQPSRALLKSGG